MDNTQAQKACYTVKLCKAKKKLKQKQETKITENLACVELKAKVIMPP